MRKVKFTTTLGEIVLELDDEKAPISTQNMIEYIESGHYDGLLFHRIIDGFMVQGGGYDHELKKRKGRSPIENEAKNGLKNVKGAVAMARTPDIGSATSQFFINVVDNPFLDHKDETPEGYGYAVFGKVIEGEETVDKIRQAKTGAKGPFSKDCPVEDIVIEKAEVLDGEGKPEAKKEEEDSDAKNEAEESKASGDVKEESKEDAKESEESEEKDSKDEKEEKDSEDDKDSDEDDEEKKD